MDGNPNSSTYAYAPLASPSATLDADTGRACATLDAYTRRASACAAPDADARCASAGRRSGNASFGHSLRPAIDDGVGRSHHSRHDEDSREDGNGG